MSHLDRYGNILEDGDRVLLFSYLKREAVLAPKTLKDPTPAFQDPNELEFKENVKKTRPPSPEYLEYLERMKTKEYDFDTPSSKEVNTMEKQPGSFYNSDNYISDELKPEESSGTDLVAPIEKNKNKEKAKVISEKDSSYSEVLEKELAAFQTAKELGLNTIRYLDIPVLNYINRLTVRANKEITPDTQNLEEVRAAINASFDKESKQQPYTRKEYQDLLSKLKDSMVLVKSPKGKNVIKFNNIDSSMLDAFNINKEQNPAVLDLEKRKNVAEQELKDLKAKYRANRYTSSDEELLEMKKEMQQRQKKLDNTSNELKFVKEKSKDIDVVRNTVDGKNTSNLDKLINQTKRNLSLWDNDKESSFFLIEYIDDNTKYKYAVVNSNDIIKISNVNVDTVINNVSYEIYAS